MAEKQRAIPEEGKKTFTKVPACDERRYGGAEVPGNGTTCVGGSLFYWAKYNGKLERYVKRCPCGGTFSEATREKCL